MEYFKFGSYYQKTSSGKTPIEWLAGTEKVRLKGVSALPVWSGWTADNTTMKM
jgi:hypothetical protein